MLLLKYDEEYICFDVTAVEYHADDGDSNPCTLCTVNCSSISFKESESPSKGHKNTLNERGRRRNGLGNDG